MASKRSRQRQNRRDRRKAKASNWKRSGKQKPGRVGHGTSGVDDCGQATDGKANSQPKGDRVIARIGRQVTKIPKHVIAAIRNAVEEEA